MSAFDLNVRVLAIDINEREVEEGVKQAEVVLTTGMVLPFSAGPDQPPIVAPVGTLRFVVDRDAAENIAARLNEVAENLPKRSNIAVASDLSGVERAAEFTNKLKG